MYPRGKYDGYRVGSYSSHAAVELAYPSSDEVMKMQRNVRVTSGTDWHHDAYKCWEKICGGRYEVHKMEIEKHEARVAELNRALYEESYEREGLPDRYDYARRYDELIARRTLHEDFMMKKALLGAPEVRHNFIEMERGRADADGRTLTPMAGTLYDWRMKECQQLMPHLYSGPEIAKSQKAYEIEARKAQSLEYEQRKAEQMRLEASAAASALAAAHEAARTSGERMEIKQAVHKPVENAPKPSSTVAAGLFVKNTDDDDDFSGMSKDMKRRYEEATSRMGPRPSSCY